MATITNVQAAKYGTGTTSATVSWNSTPTAGNLLIARSYVLGGTSSGSITGWTQVVNVLYGVGNRYVAIYVKVAGVGEGSVTCTATSATTTSLVIEEWSSSTGWASTPLDQTASTATTGSSVTSRSTGTTAATTVTDELAVSVIGFGGTVTGISWSNSFTASFEQPTGALVFAGAHKVLSATGAVESTASWTTARVAGAAVATFKPNNSVSMSASVASFALTGIDSSLKKASLIAGGVGVFSFTGNSAALSAITPIQLTAPMVDYDLTAPDRIPPDDVVTTVINADDVYIARNGDRYIARNGDVYVAYNTTQAYPPLLTAVLTENDLTAPERY